MTYEDIWHQLTTVYDDNEAKAITRYLLEVRYKMSVTDIYCGKVTQLSAEDTEDLTKIISRLIQSEPIQYILGQAEFAGRNFHVAPGVLIPRPETAELCQWIEDIHSTAHPLSILDIGTGSGCIAITLALACPNYKVTAWDVSAEALKIAQINNRHYGNLTTLIHQDVLQAPDDTNLWDIIVSNPPYICHKEKALMQDNVLSYEPAIALFVPDNNPLLFYNAIALYALKALKPNGSLFFEINAIYQQDTIHMLQQLGYTKIASKDDMFGKPRFIRAKR